MSRAAPPPLYVDAHRLAREVLEAVGGSADPLPRRLAEDTLTLLDAVVLALKGFDPADRAERADEALVVLRAHLRLAVDLGIVPERRGVHLLEQADTIGRQLGGWRKRLDAPPAEGPPRIP